MWYDGGVATLAMPLNLGKCKIGQRLKTREEGLMRYVGQKCEEDPRAKSLYPYETINELNKTCTYTQQGVYFIRDSTMENLDILEVLPFTDKDEEWALGYTISKIWET